MIHRITLSALSRCTPCISRRSDSRCIPHDSADLFYGFLIVLLHGRFKLLLDYAIKWVLGKFASNRLIKPVLHSRVTSTCGDGRPHFPMKSFRSCSIILKTSTPSTGKAFAVPSVLFMRRKGTYILDPPHPSSTSSKTTSSSERVAMERMSNVLEVFHTLFSFTV